MDKRTALITGAGRGIGAAIAKRLAADGFNIVITCLSVEEPAEEVADECRALGAEAITLYGNCADSAVCKDWIAKSLDKFA